METTRLPIKFKRLSRLNIFSKFEVAEIPKILMSDEQVLGVMSGFYSAGTATLCVTSHRLLLIDKKLMHLNYEDVRFEAISEVNFSQQLLLASVKFYFGGRKVEFRSWYKRELRTLSQFVENKMFESRSNSHAPTDGYSLARVINQLNAATPSPTESSMQSDEHQSILSRKLNIKAPQFSRHNRLTKFARWQRASKFIERLPILQAANRQTDYPL